MTGKCIQDLSAAIDGSKLRFGTMPPLGGNLEPIGRIVPVGAAIQPRDVVVFTAEDERRDEVTPTELYFQGALGVVTSRPVTPLPGGFSLQVPCVTDALHQMVGWSRAASSTVVVAVVGNDRLPTKLPPLWDDIFGWIVETDASLALPFRALQSLDSEQVTLVNCQPAEVFGCGVYESLAPDVLVLATPIDAGQLNTLLAYSADNAWVISSACCDKQRAMLEEASSHHCMQWCHVRATPYNTENKADDKQFDAISMASEEMLAIGIASNVKIAVLELLRNQTESRKAS